jgi:hypothetical protein
MTAADVERLRGHCQHTTDSIWELQGLLESQTEENNVLKQQLHAAHVAYETLQREQHNTHKGALEHLSTAKGRQHEHMKVLRKLDEARAQIDDQTVKLVEAAALQEALIQMEHKLAITHNTTSTAIGSTLSSTNGTGTGFTATAGAGAAAGSSVNSSSEVAGVTQLPLQQLPSAQDRLQAVYDRAKLQGKLEGLASKAHKAKQQQQQQSNAVKRRTSVTVTATAAVAVSAAVTTSQQLNSIKRASSKRRLSAVNVTAASTNSDSNVDDSDASSTQQQQQRSVKRENSIASLPRVQEAAAATAAANNVTNVRASSSGYGNGPRHSSVRAATATPTSALRKASIQPAIELKHRASQVLAVKPAEVLRTINCTTASTQTVVSDELPVPPAVHSKQRSQDHAVQCEILSNNSSSSSDVSAVSMRLPPVVSPIRQSGGSTQQRHSVSVKRINVDTFAVIPDAVTAQLRPTAVSPLAVPAKPSVAQSDVPIVVQQLEVAEAESSHVQKHKLRKWRPHDIPAPVAAVSPQTDTTSIDNSNNSSSSRGAAQCVASALLGKQSNDGTAVQEQSDTTNIASVHATVSDSSGSHNAREGSATAGLKDNSQHSQEAAVKHQQKKQQQQQQQQHKLQTIEDGTPCDDSSVGDYGSVHSATNASQFAAASTVSMSSMSSALSDNMLFITVMQESSGSYALKTLLQELLSLCTAVLQPTDGHVSHKALMHHATVLHSTGIPLLKRILRGYGLVSSRWNHVSCYNTC